MPPIVTYRSFPRFIKENRTSIHLPQRSPVTMEMNRGYFKDICYLAQLGKPVFHSLTSL